MQRRYMVYTPQGYFDVHAWSAEKAKECVYRLTLGRVEIKDMTVREIPR